MAAVPITTQTLEDAVLGWIRFANKTRNVIQQTRDESAAGSIGRSRVKSLLGTLTSYATYTQNVGDLPGALQRLRDELNDQNIQASEVANSRTTALAVRDWIFANFPKDAGTGVFLISSTNSSGSDTELTFSTAALANFRIACDTFLATLS